MKSYLVWRSIWRVSKVMCLVSWDSRCPKRGFPAFEGLLKQALKNETTQNKLKSALYFIFIFFFFISILHPKCRNETNQLKGIRNLRCIFNLETQNRKHKNCIVTRTQEIHCHTFVRTVLSHVYKKYIVTRTQEIRCHTCTRNTSSY